MCQSTQSVLFSGYLESCVDFHFNINNVLYMTMSGFIF